MEDIDSSRIFESKWWSVKLPLGWTASQDEICASLQANPQLGVLQISSAFKDVGGVTDEDLRDYANENGPSKKDLIAAAYGTFSGFSNAHSDGKLFWTEWWLKKDHLMIYATYNVRQDLRTNAAREFAIVEDILTSIKTRK